MVNKQFSHLNVFAAVFGALVSTPSAGNPTTPAPELQKNIG